MAAEATRGFRLPRDQRKPAPRSSTVSSPFAMPFHVALRENVVYVSWRGFTRDDLREVSLHITERRRALGRDVVYVSRIPAGGGAFSDDDNAALLEFVLGILPSCAAVHHIIEGDGFVRSARLATLTHLANATPRARDFHAHESLDAAAAAIRAQHGVDLRDIGTASSVPPAVERASSAFRAAARIIEAGRSRKE